MIKILDKLLSIGYLTGSRAFGTHRKDSDYDIVYPINKANEIQDIIKDYEMVDSNYFAGYVINVEGQDINLIPVHPAEFLPWVLATIAMTATYKHTGIIDSIKKYAIFMGMVSMFKGTLDMSMKIDNITSLNKWLKDGQYEPE